MKQQAANEAPLDGHLERVELVVAVVCLQAKRAKPGKRPLVGDRVDQIDGVPGEQVGTLAADVADLGNEITGQLLLDHEIPILVGKVLAMAIDRLWSEELILGVQERNQRVGQCGKVGGTQTEARNGALCRIAEVVVLVAAVVDTVAGAKDGSAVKRSRRPGRPEPRSQVAIVRAIVGSTPRAKSAAALDVYNGRAVQDLMHHCIVF